MATLSTTEAPGATLLRRWMTGSASSFAPARYTSSTVAASHGEVPVLVTFQPVAKLVLGSYVIPFAGDCQFSWQSSSGAAVRVGTGDAKEAVAVSDWISAWMADGDDIAVLLGNGVLDGLGAADGVLVGCAEGDG